METNKSYCQNVQSPQICDIVQKNKAHLNGTCINIVPVSIGVQYQRRKISSQEYQSRLYYNTNEYVQEGCQEELYTAQMAVSSGVSLTSTSKSPHKHQLQQKQQQSQSNQQIESVDQGQSNRKGVATQTNICDQESIGPSSLLYTVHRVITTAEIQTAAGNAFAASSSVSSVVSAVRNENDCTNVNISGLQTSPGMNTTSIYQDSGNNSDIIPSSNVLNNYNSTATNYFCGVKSPGQGSRPLQNVIPTCVYLMSRIAVHMEVEETTQCPAQVMLAAALGCEELGITNKLLAQSIFALWMTSALLEIQLKSHHRPYVIRVAWSNLLDKFSQGNPIEKKFDEPMTILKRNVFFSKKDEEKIKDHRILELLYEEAKHNVLTGRYIMESVHLIMLGGIQARIDLGPYNSHTHTISYFRENQLRYLPQHIAKNNWSWLPISRKNSAEVKLLEQYKRLPQAITTKKLMKKYLEFCWALPFYGAAFFHGQVEQSDRGLLNLVSPKDISVLVAINERGIFIIDPVECTLLLGLRYEDLSWDCAKPSVGDDPDCITCIFLQFDVIENGFAVSKLMQIFSRQAAMMDALIAYFVNQMKRKKDTEGLQAGLVHDDPNPIQNNGNGVLCNKLSRLTLATFDEEGRCLGQMGSLSISYI